MRANEASASGTSTARPCRAVLVVLGCGARAAFELLLALRGVTLNPHRTHKDNFTQYETTVFVCNVCNQGETTRRVRVRVRVRIRILDLCAHHFLL